MVGEYGGVILYFYEIMVKAKCVICKQYYQETWSNKYILGYLGNMSCFCEDCYNKRHSNKCKEVETKNG